MAPATIIIIEITIAIILGVILLNKKSRDRYCEELEKENKIEQIGKTGRNVIYRPKP